MATASLPNPRPKPCLWESCQLPVLGSHLLHNKEEQEVLVHYKTHCSVFAALAVKVLLGMVQHPTGFAPWLE